MFKWSFAKTAERIPRNVLLNLNSKTSKVQRQGHLLTLLNTSELLPSEKSVIEFVTKTCLIACSITLRHFTLFYCVTFIVTVYYFVLTSYGKTAFKTFGIQVPKNRLKNLSARRSHKI